MQRPGVAGVTGMGDIPAIHQASRNQVAIRRGLIRATGSGSGPLGAFAVKYGIVPRSPKVSIVSEQGTKMLRQSFIHIELVYPAEGDVPSRIEVGGAVVPTLKGELVGGW